jgi:hypothetical protein
VRNALPDQRGIARHVPEDTRRRVEGGQARACDIRFERACGALTWLGRAA